MSDTPKLTVAVEHTGCSYLAREDSVCTKCGKYVKPYMTLERENADLRAKLEAAQRDAERYRWLRAAEVIPFNIMHIEFMGEVLDARIDAAMQESRT